MHIRRGARPGQESESLFARSVIRKFVRSPVDPLLGRVLDENVDGHRVRAAARLAPILDGFKEFATDRVVCDDDERFAKSGRSGVAHVELRLERDKTSTTEVGRAHRTPVDGSLRIGSEFFTVKGTLVGADVGQIEGLVEARQVDMRKDMSDERSGRAWRWRLSEDAGAGWGGK